LTDFYSRQLFSSILIFSYYKQDCVANNAQVQDEIMLKAEFILNNFYVNLNEGPQILEMVVVTRFLYWTNPVDVSQKLQSYWSAVSVTLALVGTMAFSGVITTPDPSPYWESAEAIRNLQAAACGCFAISLLLSGFGVSLCLIFYAQVNQIPAENLFAFLEHYSWSFWFTTVFFLGSIILLIAGTLLFILVSQGSTVSIIFGVISVVGTVSISSLYVSMNRKSASLQSVEKAKNFDNHLELKEK
jgi:hypothetical protein